MRFIKPVFYIFLWLALLGLTSLALVVTTLLALIRGRQEQYFVQKSIFDPGGKETS